MKPIVISLLVHEQPLVVIDQLQNIKKFVPNSITIVHINRCFSGDPRLIIEYAIDSSVLINENFLAVGWADLIQAHNSNFRYAKQQLGQAFDKFCLHASNDLFVRSGVESYINSHHCGVNTFVTHKDMQWTPRRRAEHDDQLRDMLNYVGSDSICCSQPEGTFYDVTLFEEINRVIDLFFVRDKIKSYQTKNDNDHNNTLYAREEVYYPTLAKQLSTQITFPYVFSEVMSWPRVSIDNNLIDQVRNITTPAEYCLERRLFEKQQQLYDRDFLFGVKRIQRKIDDPVREYVRRLNV